VLPTRTKWRRGRILVYEGHDRPRIRGGPDPKTLDQELQTPAGTLMQNGLFFGAARRALEGRERAELVRVYEKVRSGIWVFNGVFRLLDAWAEQIDGRRVFKFRLEIAADESAGEEVPEGVLEATRIIPTSVKLEVWKRDKGRCVECGSADNLHFDHIIPWSRGGSSLTAENVQLRMRVRQRRCLGPQIAAQALEHAVEKRLSTLSVGDIARRHSTLFCRPRDDPVVDVAETELRGH
jgi:HNH endonuclease